MLSDDNECVDRVLGGEPEAFEFLVKKYNRLAGAIAFAILGDFQRAEDVVQESFLKALRSLPTLREPDRFKYWLSGIVRSKAIDVRRERRLEALEVDLPSPPAEGAGEEPIDAVLREERRSKILEVVGGLPEEDRIVVVLKHMEGLSYKEIAQLTESTESAVESRLVRARQELRKKLEAWRVS
jgi:RNA polymerase sigma-70 factor (ECF subfamily)